MGRPRGLICATRFSSGLAFHRLIASRPFRGFLALLSALGLTALLLVSSAVPTPQRVAAAAEPAAIVSHGGAGELWAGEPLLEGSVIVAAPPAAVAQASVAQAYAATDQAPDLDWESWPTDEYGVPPLLPGLKPESDGDTTDAPPYYVVEPGDTLSGIALALDVKASDLIDLNNLNNPDELAIGQRLAVPSGTDTSRAVASSRGSTRPSFVWPAYGNITTYFGEKGRMWVGGKHLGLDVGADYGDSVVASAAGTVTMAAGGYNRGMGNLVVIDNGNGYETRYAHLSRILVKAGDQVRRGQLIGKVGSTGYSTGPHLHFEVHVNGVPTNPLRFLP